MPVPDAWPNQRQLPLRKSSWFTLWLAPHPLSRSGRSALSSNRGMAPWSASTQAGNSWATADPEVVITAAGTPVARASPRAKKAAERSSRAVCRRSRRCWSRPAANASGAERLPGHSTACPRPARWRPPRSSRAALRFASARSAGEDSAATAAGTRGWMHGSSSRAPADRPRQFKADCAISGRTRIG